MQTVSLHKAKDHLLELVEAANAGEDVFIKANEHLLVQLVPR